MTKKFVWLLVSCLMVMSLLIASCGDTDSEATVTTEDEGQTVTVGDEDEEMTTPGKPSVTVDPDKPKYGGKLVILTNADITTWNPGAKACSGAGQGGYVIEQILGIDFTQGPAGTGETNFIGGVTDYRYLGGNLAESWETPAVGVWVLNIRQGVHFGNHPDQDASRLVAGREMTAEDVAYSIEYMRDTPFTSSGCNEPNLINNTTVERTGDWQITVRTPEAPGTGYLWIMGGGGVQYVWPKEFLEQYGASNNWYDVVGTGPYLLDDYVTSSAAKYIRNDNYWDVNPIGPGQGDQLPYIDSINYQIIPDYSTRLAALRTGKADWSFIDVLTIEDFDTIIKTYPEIEYVQTIIAPQQIAGRVDLPGPYSDKRVRQAMMLAIDHPTIVRDLYDGKAELIDSPARKWYDTIHTPLEELPQETQELYGFNPEKAKQLLADAGYPEGFKIKMVMSNGTAQEQASAIVKEYWRAVGIDVELSILEPTVFIGLWVGHASEDLVLSAFPGGDGSLFVRYSMGYYRGPNIFNLSHVNDPVGTDPVIEAAYNKQNQYVMVNYPEADKVTKEAYAYALGEAFNIPMPAPWGYRVWQPWVKNYYGANDVKFWLRWAWLDQDLKEEMTGRR
ncbi:ABC transporter substrate-binding protein [Chloroflexota bacterium]